ncbi:hypothetical protein ARTHRO8AJ_40165 [Arthrobacter sp. 8AJ]|nr:hypothetical protein ARTHRO8AJ_40165 [Arthrobacter sp. 8AJ]
MPVRGGTVWTVPKTRLSPAICTCILPRPYGPKFGATMQYLYEKIIVFILQKADN